MPNRVDLLEFLLVNPKAFSMMAREQQLELAKNRPTPYLDIMEYVNGSRIHFQTQWYTTYYWLTGSLFRQKLYCFMCLLYGHISVISLEEGEFGGFYDKANDHQNSRQHIQNCELYANLMNSQQLNCSGHKKEIWLESERKSFKKIVQLLYLTSKITFKKIEITEINVLQETVSFLANNEIFMSETSAINLSELTSEGAQIDIVKALNASTRKIIISEIKNSDFISVLIDRVDDKPTGIDRYSLIVRYVTDNSIRERFLDFFEMSQKCSGEEVFEKAYGLLSDWGIENRLVCISYDIPHLYITSKALNISFNKEDYIKPFVLHNCNYDLNRIIWQSCLKIESVSSFASNVSMLYNFFNDKKRYLQFTKEGISIPSNMFNFDGEKNFRCPKGFLSMLATNFLTLKNAVNIVTQNSSWDDISIALAKQILLFLKNPKSVLTLCFFNKVFIQIDHLSCYIRMMSYKDISRILIELKDTISSIYNINTEESIINLWDETLKILGTNLGEKIRLNVVETKVSFNQIVIAIIKNLRTRFSDYYWLDILQLVNFKKFTKSENDVTEIIQKYLNHFNVLNFSKLKNELLIIYSDQSKHLDAKELLNYFKCNGLENVFDETIKFIHFIQILPFTCVTHKKMTKYERVKRFGEVFLSNDEPSEYGMVVIEKEILDELISNESFLQDVMEEFAKSNTHNKFSLVKNSNLNLF